jgi:hypothetical protein
MAESISAKRSANAVASFSAAQRYTRDEIFAEPSPVPAKSGVHGWWFRDIPGEIDVSGCEQRDGLTLLYVGVSPGPPRTDGKPQAPQDLRKRIRRMASPPETSFSLRIFFGQPDDRRFAAFGAAFRRWDCAAPVASLAGCGALGAVNIFAADPPYLTRDCLAAFGEAMAALRAAPGAPLLLCTGAALEADAREVLGCRRTRFAVRHAGGLANPFALFVNYEGGAAAGPMGGWADEAP